MNKLGGFIRLTRPVNCTMMGFAVLVGAILASPQLGSLNWLNILFGFLTGFTFCAAAMVINDYYDRKIDAINEPKRPIPSGTVKPNEALAFMVGLTVVGFVFAGLVVRVWFAMFCCGSGFSGYNCNLHYRWKAKWVAWKLFSQRMRRYPIHLRQHNRDRNRRVECAVVCIHGFPFQHGQGNHQRHCGCQGRQRRRSKDIGSSVWRKKRGDYGSGVFHFCRSFNSCHLGFGACRHLVYSLCFSH